MAGFGFRPKPIAKKPAPLDPVTVTGPVTTPSDVEGGTPPIIDINPTLLPTPEPVRPPNPGPIPDHVTPQPPVDDDFEYNSPPIWGVPPSQPSIPVYRPPVITPQPPVYDNPGQPIFPDDPVDPPYLSPFPPSNPDDAYNIGPYTPPAPPAPAPPPPPPVLGDGLGSEYGYGYTVKHGDSSPDSVPIVTNTQIAGSNGSYDPDGQWQWFYEDHSPIYQRDGE